ncbi:MAG: Ig-like domain-containing protein, partial [Pseudonocardia sp.]|nr:Ig-like domain-containing protein [Pseudonocardia sp.]
MRIGWIFVTACAVAACANANPDTSALDVSDATLTVPVGGKVSVSATSQRMDVGGATWSSDTPTIATVDGSGGSATITGVAPGTCMVTVQLGVAQRSIEVTVSGGVLDRIDVTTPSASVPLGRTLALTATGHYSDGSTKDITGSATWDTGDQTVATVDAAGTLTGHKVGQTQVTAAVDAITGHADVAIGAAQVTSITVDPPSHSLAKGLSYQLTATGTFTDGTTSDVTAMVTWMSSDATHATV